MFFLNNLSDVSSNFGDILSGDNSILNYSEWGLTNFYSENNRNDRRSEHKNRKKYSYHW